MPLNYRVTTPPIVEPVTLALAKNHLRVDFPDDDTLISGMISAARRFAERYMFRAIYNQTWVRSMDHFPLWFNNDGTVNPAYRNDWPYYSDFWNRITIDVPMPACVSVLGITYIDQNGATQTLSPSAYYVDTFAEPARIVPAQGNYWPTAMTYQPGSVQIKFVAGTWVVLVTSEILTLPSTLPAGKTAFSYSAAFINPETGAPAPITAVVSLLNGSLVPIPFTLNNSQGVTSLSISATAAGQTLALSYYAGICPFSIVAGILQVLGHLYEHREMVSEVALKSVPNSALSLFDQDKITNLDLRPL